MRQLALDYRTGVFSMAEVPAPAAGSGQLLIRTVASAVSVGTERQTVDFAKRSLLSKALARPDLVRQVVAKVRAEGLDAAWRASRARLDVPVALGYASAGVVVEVGRSVEGFEVGDRVACSGQGHAGHGEFAAVPADLCVKIPGNVSDEHASFAALGAIAMHSVRHAQARPGDRVVVVGLGLLGQMAVQVLAAWGVRVFGTDLSPDRVKLARELGAEAAAVTGPDVADQIRTWAGDAGCRAAVILAATPSNAPLELAAKVCGERGRIVAAGLVGLEVPRPLFFEKELELLVPRAWGAGSHRPAGRNSPPGEPRANQNLDEFLALVAKGEVKLDRLLTHRFAFDDAQRAYDLILHGREPFLGVVLHYGSDAVPGRRIDVAPPSQEGALRIGVIGAGAFGRGTMLPILQRAKVDRVSIATSRPVEARSVASRSGFRTAATTSDEVIKDETVDAVFILTRHDSHARLAAEALAAGKKVFVEKPLATTESGLRSIRDAHRSAKDPCLFVGFNRRYAPATRFVLEHMAGRQGPFAVHCTVNAGKVDVDSWINDPIKGGGRIVGEVCHFIDLVAALTNSTPVAVSAFPIGERVEEEDVSLQLRMSDGSVGSILYATDGAKSYSRETIDVIGGGLVARIDNFRQAVVHAGGAGVKRWRSMGVDRGHEAEVDAFLRCARDPSAPRVAFETDVATTAATFAAVRSLRDGGRLTPLSEVLS